MTAIKTTFSLPEALFNATENLARSMNLSRSRLIALALEEFIQRENQRLLDSINAAYADDEPDPEEETRLDAMRRIQRELLEGEWDNQLMPSPC